MTIVTAKIFTPNRDWLSITYADGSYACVPTDPDNTDYQAFKQDLANGVALSDAEGTTMTADQIKTFLETLP